MSESVSVRPLTEADYDPLIRVLDDWWGGRAMSAMLPRLFFTHFGETSLVAEADGVLIGFLAGFASPALASEGYIHFVGVHPDHRGQGVGHTLYTSFFGVMRAHSRSLVRAVTAPTNRASIAFHRRMGFRPKPGPAELDGTPFWPDYDGPGEHRVLFSRSLVLQRDFAEVTPP